MSFSYCMYYTICQHLLLLLFVSKVLTNFIFRVSLLLTPLTPPLASSSPFPANTHLYLHTHLSFAQAALAPFVPPHDPDLVEALAMQQFFIKSIKSIKSMQSTKSIKSMQQVQEQVQAARTHSLRHTHTNTHANTHMYTLSSSSSSSSSSFYSKPKREQSATEIGSRSN